jgi:hypothetical protein
LGNVPANFAHDVCSVADGLYGTEHRQRRPLMSNLSQHMSEDSLPPVALAVPEPDFDLAADDPRLESMRRMWSRVLAMSICDYWLAPQSSVRFKESQAWLFCADSDSANSFHNVCQFLRLDPTRTKAMIARRCSEYRQDPSKAEPVIKAMQTTGFEATA